MAQFQAGCTDLELQLEELFQEVDELRGQLVCRLQQLEQREARLDAQVCELDERREELDTAQTQLEAAQAELLRRQTEHAQSADSHAATLEAELQATRTELQATRIELQETLDALHSERELRTPAAEQDQDHEQDSERDVEFSRLEEERQALEEELELVRGRAAELNETVVHQQRKLDEQKSELSGELKQLRRLVEKQADLISNQDDEPAAVAVAEKPAATEAGDDPVVTSVMAQFARLQRNVAQRRRPRQN